MMTRPPARSTYRTFSNLGSAAAVTSRPLTPSAGGARGAVGAPVVARAGAALRVGDRIGAGCARSRRRAFVRVFAGKGESDHASSIDAGGDRLAGEAVEQLQVSLEHLVKGGVQSSHTAAPAKCPGFSRAAT